MKKEVKLYKTTSVSFATEPDAVFFVKGVNETVVRTYITTSDGQAIPLKDLSGGGGGSGIQFLASGDSSISITGTATSKNIQVSSALQTLINSALQSGDLISTLINDAGYITLADVPTFNPSDYDLSDFTNTSPDPFVKQSEITSGATNLGYTASPTNGVVTSDTGSDATIPLADNTNAGLLSPAEKSEIATAIQPSDLGAVATSNDYNDLDNIPTSFPPSAHTHVEADITDLDKYTQSQTDTLLNGKVPYTGATTNVNLGEFQLKAGQIEFDQTPTGTFGVGKVRWNDTDGTTERRLKGNNVTLQDGLEVLKRVVNKAGSDLVEANYQVVRTRSVAEGGAQGQRPAVVLAQANTNDNSKSIIGVVTETILNNQEGFITLIGEVRNVNTTGSLQSETWVDGDLLYLSPIVAGQLTKIVPSSPHYSIPIGTVDYAHATQGKISVHVGNKIALDTTLTNDNDTAPSVTAVKTYVDNGLATKQNNLFNFYTKEGFLFHEDFIGNPGTSSFATGYGLIPAISGAVATCIPTTTYPNRTNQQGVLQLGTGTTATGSSNIRLGDNNAGSIYTGNGEIIMQCFYNVQTLSTITERFYEIIGFMTSGNFVNTNTISFIYDEGGVGNYGSASANWKCITRVSPTSTTTITTVPVVEGQWYVLKIVINSLGDSISFFIDNVLVATHTTNIPTLITPRIAKVKTIGATNRNSFLDYVIIQQIYATPRTI